MDLIELRLNEKNVSDSKKALCVSLTLNNGK